MKCDKPGCNKIAVWQIRNQFACDRHVAELEKAMQDIIPGEKQSLQLKLFGKDGK
jgi:hypothetical protein